MRKGNRELSVALGPGIAGSVYMDEKEPTPIQQATFSTYPEI